MNNYEKDMILLNDDISKKIETFGYAVIGVFDDEQPTNPNFCYTVGLCEDLGFELITIGNFNIDIMHTIINEQAIELIQSNESPLEKGIFGGALLKNGSELRCKYIDVTDVKGIDDMVTHTYNDMPKKIYQLLFADQNNILPGEECYDKNFNQTIK